MVICVDSAVAHLAGAQGKPVWIMLRHSGEWRWLLERSDSPWYPTARLFRQKKPGDWAGVVSDITQQLQALTVHSKGSGGHDPAPRFQPPIISTPPVAPGQ